MSVGDVRSASQSLAKKFYNSVSIDRGSNDAAIADNRDHAKHEKMPMSVCAVLVAAASLFTACTQSVGPGGVQQSVGPFQQSVGPGGVRQSAGPAQQSVTPSGAVRQGFGPAGTCEANCGGQRYTASCNNAAIPVCQCQQSPYAYCQARH